MCGPECRPPTPTQAHCAVCHETFGTPSAFLAHRVDGACVHPVMLCMSNASGVWRTAMEEAAAARLAQMRAARTKAVA